MIILIYALQSGINFISKYDQDDQVSGTQGSVCIFRKLTLENLSLRLYFQFW